MMKTAFIGGGNMASALIGGLLKRGASPADLLAIDPDQTARDALRTQFGIHTRATAGALLNEYEVVLFAVKPQQLKAAAQQAAPALQHALVISIAAGVRMAEIARWLGGHQRLVRAMPNLPALIGMGITGLTALPGVNAADRGCATQLLEAVGSVIWCQDEHAIDAIAAISGSGPAYVFYFIEALERAAHTLGFNPEESHALAIATVQGAAQLAAHSNQAVSLLRERVTSKGGTTAAALAAFEHAHLAEAIMRGAQAAQARAKEIGDSFNDEPV